MSILLEAELEEHYGVPLDFITLLHEDAVLSSTLLQAPQHTLQVLEDALITAQASRVDLGALLGQYPMRAAYCNCTSTPAGQMALSTYVAATKGTHVDPFQTQAILTSP